MTEGTGNGTPNHDQQPGDNAPAEAATPSGWVVTKEAPQPADELDAATPRASSKVKKAASRTKPAPRPKVSKPTPKAKKKSATKGTQRRAAKRPTAAKKAGGKNKKKTSGKKKTAPSAGKKKTARRR